MMTFAYVPPETLFVSHSLLLSYIRLLPVTDADLWNALWLKISVASGTMFLSFASLCLLVIVFGRSKVLPTTSLPPSFEQSLLLQQLVANNDWAYGTIIQNAQKEEHTLVDAKPILMPGYTSHKTIRPVKLLPLE